MRQLRNVTIVLLLLVVYEHTFAEPPTSSRPGWPATALSIFLGFGTGQYYLGQNGTGFLIADLLGLAAMVAGAEIGIAYPPPSSHSTAPYSAETNLAYALAGAGAFVYVISRIWEVVDVLDLEDRLQYEGKISMALPRLAIIANGIVLRVPIAG